MSGQAAQSFGAGAPAVGDVLAQKYRVESIVGRGGMGVVLSARHVQLGQVVAIKLLTLPPDEDRRDEAIGRFLHEAQAAAKLQNDHVVRIYDVGQLDNGLPFMVMELLVGADLGTVLDERGALPEPEAVDYLLQACAGVAEAHRMGIVHRDLKPSNLFVTKRSDGLPLLKVLDFGISKQLTDPASGEAVPTFTNTRTLMGSPHYMSPEQVRDARRVDARADIWALGVILQELITDAPVFHGESFPGVCAAIVADPPMPVRTMRPDVSTALEAIIGRCLEKDAKLRFQSVAELQAALMPLAPRMMRSGSISQPLAYSSGTREAATPIRISNSATPGDPTIASAPPEMGRTGPDRTLESARLPPRQSSTQNALASTDPRVAVVERRTSPPAKSKVRLLVPLAVAALLAAGALWLRSRPSHVATVSSSEPQPSAAPAAPTSFTLSIDSEPSGASVTEGSTHLGTTPFSLSLSISEHAGPRVFVVERDGYLPYVVRQGAARGEVRVMAALTRRIEVKAEPVPSTTVPVVRPPPTPPSARQRRQPVKKPPPAATPPSDIRLER